MIDIQYQFLFCNFLSYRFLYKINNALLGLENELDKMLDDKVFDKVTINDINGRLCELFTKSASECNMARELNSMNKNTNKKMKPPLVLRSTQNIVCRKHHCSRALGLRTAGDNVSNYVRYDAKTCP